MKNHLAARKSSFTARQSPLASRCEPAVATPSPRWRENLRQACLDRARRKRRDLFRKRRQLSFDGDQPARMVVDEELRQQGVVIHSKCLEEGSTATFVSSEFSPLDSPDRTIINRTMDFEFGNQDHEVISDIPIAGVQNLADPCISEDDLYDLLQEVENELYRNGMLKNFVYLYSG